MRPLFLRVALAAAALAAALVTLERARDEEREVGRLAALARQHGLALADVHRLERELERETSGGFRRLAVARRLLDLGLDRSRWARAVAARDPLADARALAREAIALQPVSWEAPMVAGAAIALERMRDRDPRYFSRWRDWEAPLALADARFPASRTPDRYLAAAYLETWPALSPQKRPEVEALLRRMFEDDRFSALLFDRWLELAGSLDAAAALLPDRPESWRRLEESALRGWQLGPALRYRERARSAERRRLEARLEAAVADLERGGERQRARTELAAILVAAPLAQSNAPLVERALAKLPAGPAGRPLAESARRWLEWSLPLCLARDCPLAPAAYARLGSLAGAELPSELDAAAAVAAGDPIRAERLALRGQALWSEAWAPYLLLAAKTQLAAGAAAEAAARLAPLHREARRWLAARRIARAAGAGGFAGPAPEAERWEPTEWRGAGALRALELLPARAATGLVVRLSRPAPRALVVAEWDGEPLAPVALAAGDRELRLRLPVAAEPHLLRLSLLAGELPEPAVTVLD